MYQQSLPRINQVHSSTTLESGSPRNDQAEAVSNSKSLIEQTPLSIFVRERLHDLGLKQSDFCRRYSFDQGMLSRIQNSMVFNLNLESVLRLAIGLQVSPLKILELIGRTDLHDLVSAAYANELLDYLESNINRAT